MKEFSCVDAAWKSMTLLKFLSLLLHLLESLLRSNRVEIWWWLVKHFSTHCCDMQVIVFSSEGSSLTFRPDIPVVALAGIDDSYPPQRKSFAMLQYMYNYYHDKYRFFMRVDDDVYVHDSVLRPFLHSINSTCRPLFVGQVLVTIIQFVCFKQRFRLLFCDCCLEWKLKKNSVTQMLHWIMEICRCIVRNNCLSCVIFRWWLSA